MSNNLVDLLDFKFRFQVLDFKLQISSFRSQGLDFRIEDRGSVAGGTEASATPATALKTPFKNPLGLET